MDVALIVAGLDGDFNLRRLERYLAVAWSGGTTPVVLLNKADIAVDPRGCRAAAQSAAPGVEVRLVAALAGTGVAELAADHLRPGRTAVVLGSSGVGKSTLVNTLLGEQRLRTADVRADDGRGRHTTTHRELHRLPGGGLLIDTPGIRSLAVAGADDGLTPVFADVEALAASCRFTDCGHRDEPGCEVRAAVADGRLTSDRLASPPQARARGRARCAERGPPSPRGGPPTLEDDPGRVTRAHGPEVRERAMSEISIRAYRGLADIPGMGAANARLRERVGVLDPIDVAAMEHRYTHLVNSDPLVDCRVAERGGTTVGYLRVEWHDLVDGDRVFDLTTVVEPGAWSRGLADALLSWGESRSREIAATLPADRTTWLGNSSFGGDSELEDALAQRGYTAVRWGAEMLRPSLDEIADAPVAPGYHLRSPTKGELPAVFKMLVESFREHWGEYAAGEHRYDEWVDDPRFREDLVVVAWRGDKPAACVCNVLVERLDGAVRGDVAEVATHPDHRRLGLARAAITESLRRLRDAGAADAYLGVDTGNHNRAIDLYDACGFRVSSTMTTWRRPLGAAEAPR